MYLVDITRLEKEISTDMLLAKDSMDAKRKTIRYIKNYLIAKYGISIEDQVIDDNLDIKAFSLNEFMINKYDFPINEDLIIQSIRTGKEQSLLVKFYNQSTMKFPQIKTFSKQDQIKAKATISFLINEALIDKYKDDISKYESKKINVEDITTVYNYNLDDIYCESINYKSLKLDEILLNENFSLKELCDNKTVLKRYFER